MEVFSHYFFEYLFSPTVFLVSFWESDDISVDIFCYCATDFFPQYLFSCLSDWVNLIELFSIQRFHLWSSPLYQWTHPMRFLFFSFFNFGACAFQFYNFHLVLFCNFYFLDEVLYFFICFKGFHNYLLKPFYGNCFKNLCQIVPTSDSSHYWCQLTIFSHSHCDFLGSWYDKQFFFLTVYWTFCKLC